ncbi:MAG: tetratricopeptide repeat protein [Bacteroidales bacterium]
MRWMILLTMILLSVAAFAQPDKKFVRKGNNNYKEGNYQQAEVEYRKALEENPASYKADFNLGNALYKQKQYDAAAAKYAGLADKESDRQKLGRYYYNLGNALYEKKSYQESIEAYKNALRNMPADMDAKHNLQMALRMLSEQQQQQQQQQGKNDQQQNQDQQKQQQDAENQQKQGQQDQNQQQEQKGQESQDGNQPQQVKGQISPEDAERILQALENEEKDVMKRVQEKKERTQKVQSDKNW